MLDSGFKPGGNYKSKHGTECRVFFVSLTLSVEHLLVSLGLKPDQYFLEPRAEARG
jgi:hypothetical protein